MTEWDLCQTNKQKHQKQTKTTKKWDISALSPKLLSHFSEDHTLHESQGYMAGLILPFKSQASWSLLVPGEHRVTKGDPGHQDHTAFFFYWSWASKSSSPIWALTPNLHSASSEISSQSQCSLLIAERPLFCAELKAWALLSSAALWLWKCVLGKAGMRRQASIVTNSGSRSQTMFYTLDQERILCDSNHINFKQFFCLRNHIELPKL